MTLPPLHGSALPLPARDRAGRGKYFRVTYRGTVKMRQCQAVRTAGPEPGERQTSTTGFSNVPMPEMLMRTVS